MTSSTVQPRKTRSQILRFLVVGGTNTVLTYGIFIGLGLFIAPWIAYTIAFGLGLVWTAIGSSRYVFGAKFSLRRMFLFVACYLAVYGVGQLIIRLIDPQGVAELLLASLIVLVCTTPLIFLIGRYIFSPSEERPQPEKDTLP